MRRLVNIFTAIVAICILCASVSADISYEEIQASFSEDRTETADITIYISSAFYVKIPQVIQGINRNDISYAVAAYGDVPLSSTVTITPQDSINLSCDGSTVVIPVTQTAYTWSGSQVGSTSSNTNAKGNGLIKISTANLRAGTWSGTISFTISLT